jgi:hypothetical protein
MKRCSNSLALGVVPIMLGLLPLDFQFVGQSGEAILAALMRLASGFGRALQRWRGWGAGLSRCGRVPLVGDNSE